MKIGKLQRSNIAEDALKINKKSFEAKENKKTERRKQKKPISKTNGFKKSNKIKK